MAKPCIFCDLPAKQIIAENELAVATFDRYPVAPGHTLIIPRRHLVDVSEATPEELTAMFTLLREVRAILMERFAPDGFNYGINGGEAAGQAVMHLHMHVIPRKFGDVPNPRGGIRNIMPNLTLHPIELIGEEQPWEGFLVHVHPSSRQPLFVLLDQQLLHLGIDVKRRVEAERILYYTEGLAFTAIYPDPAGLKIGWVKPDFSWEWQVLDRDNSIEELLKLCGNFRQARRLVRTAPGGTSGIISKYDKFPDINNNNK